MGLAAAIPAVCSAIGSNKFAELARTTLVKRDGPTNGANVYFQFSLTAGRPLRGLEHRE
jgi:5-methylcytosine-specific restriction enzyme B